METELGVITNITDFHGIIDETFVYVRTKRGETGLHISKCRGFTPEVGQAVKVSYSVEEDWSIWPAD